MLLEHDAAGLGVGLHRLPHLAGEPEAGPAVRDAHHVLAEHVADRLAAALDVRQRDDRVGMGMDHGLDATECARSGVAAPAGSGMSRRS